MVDMIIPMLQRIQADIAELKQSLGAVNTRMDGLDARFEAQTEMFNARFIGLEHAVLELSARTFFGTKQYESTTSRYERELGELRARVARLEERVDEPK